MLLGGLFPRTDFSQLLHLRALADHYRLHRLEAAAAGQAFGLVDFLWLHFIEGDSHSHPDDGRAHDELPFHRLYNSVVLILPPVGMWAPPARRLLRQTRAFALPSFRLSDYVTECFRPPAC